MPNRWVREDAIESEPVNSVSWQAEVFWRRLLNRVDDFGRFSANLKLLRTQIFPLQIDKVSEVDVARLLSECETSGLLFAYKGLDGKPYLVLNKFEKGRAKNSKHPDPPPDVCERMQAFVYRCTHAQTNAPTSDPDNRLPNPTPDTDARGGAVELPIGWPGSVEDAIRLKPVASKATDDQVRLYWSEGAARGGRDIGGNILPNFWIYVDSRVERDRGRTFERGIGKSSGDRPKTVTELRTIKEAKERIANDLENRWTHNAPTGLEWNDPQKRQMWRDLQKEIKDLNAQIANFK